MADHRQLIERVFEVVHQRLDQAEKIGLQKLDELESQGRREFERSKRRHQDHMRKIEKKRHRAERRRAKGARHGTASGPDVARGRSAARRRTAVTPEQRAYKLARRRANLKLAFYTHFTVYMSVIMLLLVTVRSFRVAMIVALSWGIAVFLHYFWSMMAPDLREKWIDKEVGQRVDHNVSTERRRVESLHVRSLEELSASIAHEIRNPITAAKSLVSQMGEDPVSDDNIEYATVALGELDRVERSISHLLRFARDEELSFSDVCMADVARSALETFRDRASRLGVEFDLQFDTEGRMRGDPEQLRRVLINIIGNAIDAMEGARTAQPNLQIMTGDNLAGTEVWIRMRDNGPGIAPETLAKIFDPFYTTKEHGTGLGLALSKKVVDAHGGTMEVQSSPEAGTEFVLSFPKDARPEEERHA